ncbi:hypothetical protein [Dinghuibacter silviterrae]|nr:hypothetical protein [Dinghuibacter silviterrae]
MTINGFFSGQSVEKDPQPDRPGQRPDRHPARTGRPGGRIPIHDQPGRHRRRLDLKLVASRVFNTGSVLLTYQPY